MATRFEISIINHNGNGFTAFTGYDQSDFDQAVKDARATFDFLEFTTNTQYHANKDGSIWMMEYIIFLE